MIILPIFSMCRVCVVCVIILAHLHACCPNNSDVYSTAYTCWWLLSIIIPLDRACVITWMRFLECLLLFFLMHRQATGLRLLLIRHAQSQNNVIAKQMAIKYEGQSHALMRKEFEQLRSFEPNLSEVGSKQAEALKDYMLNAFRGLIGQPIPVYCSHMIR